MADHNTDELEQEPIPAEQNNQPNDIFALDDFSAADTAEMEIIPPGQLNPIGAFTFAGPGHPKSVRLSQIAHDKTKYEERQKRRNPNWSPPEKTRDEQVEENVKLITSRLVSWKINGRDADGNIVDVPFTEKTAVQLLSDPRKTWLYLQCLQFLGAFESFMPPSSQI